MKFENTRLGKLKGKEKVYVKLSPRYYGPFKVIEEINPVSFRLDLPGHWTIHNAFHVSLLKKYQGLEPTEPVLEDPPEVEELEEVLQPEQIVYHSVHKGSPGQTDVQIPCKIQKLFGIACQVDG